MSLRYLLLTVILLFAVIPAAAQEDDIPITIAPITLGLPFEDTIIEDAIYDWWLFDGRPGDLVQVEMQGMDGLAPLIGLLSPDRELVARSTDANPNDTVTLTHTLESAGQFTVIATRTGNADGTTTGRYIITVERTRPDAPPPPDRFREVTFLCGEQETQNVLTLAFEDDDDGAENIIVRAYGLDGFPAALRTDIEFSFEPFEDEFCFRDADGRGPGYGEGDVIQFPDEDVVEITTEGVTTAFIGVRELDLLEMNLGSYTGEGGRYVVVIEGMVVAPGGDRDLLEIGLGPLARDGIVHVYAISDKTSRLDPALQIIDEDTDVLYECDDAGRRDCTDVPSIDGFSLEVADTGERFEGGPFDAGLRLEPGAPEKIRVLVGGFDGRTAGPYTFVIVGEYAPPTDD